MSDFTSCSINIDQPGFYVSDIELLDSKITSIMDDSIIRTIPEIVIIWASTSITSTSVSPTSGSPHSTSDSGGSSSSTSVINPDETVIYYPEFSNIEIPAIPPPVFNPDPWSGNEQDLYTPELGIGIPFPSSVYDPSVNLEFPGGFLKPAPPLVTYNVEPYIPPLNLDIPPLSLPDISFPYLALPDMDITNIVRRVLGLRRVVINFNSVCMSADVSIHDHTEHIDLEWDVPHQGTYVLMANNGHCYWARVSPC